MNGRVKLKKTNVVFTLAVALLAVGAAGGKKGRTK